MGLMYCTEVAYLCLYHDIVLSIPNLPQFCTASAYVYRKFILKQMQYRFAVNFETLSTFPLHKYSQDFFVFIVSFLIEKKKILSYVIVFCNGYTYTSSYVWSMVLILDGNSEIGAHGWSDLDYMISKIHSL